MIASQPTSPNYCVQVASRRTATATDASIDFVPTKRTRIDWDAVERDYRANVLSIREVGRLHDVSDKAIRNKAKELDWQRDLSARIAEQVRTDLLRVKSAEQSARTENEIVEMAAATVVEVVRSHRGRIRQGSEVVDMLTRNLKEAIQHRAELEEQIELDTAEDPSPDRKIRLMKAVSLGTHATIAVNLANATKTWVGLERQAFKLDSDPEAQDLSKARVQNMTDAERAVRLVDMLRRGGKFP